MSNYFVGELRNAQDADSNSLVKGDYEDCIIENYNFSEQHLSGYNFMECRFVNCDFSNTRIGGTGLKDARFESCKLMGLNFTEASQFMIKLTFKDCNLKYTNFFKLLIAGTLFDTCELEESDFSKTDLTGAQFPNTDLTNAQFQNSILDRAEFQSAINFSIDPQKNSLNKTRFSRTNLAGLLSVHPIIIDQ